MKTVTRIFVTIVFVFTCISGLQAQTAVNQLNQQELMKQFVGTWKAELAGDTSVLIVEINPFGDSMEGIVRMVSNGRTISMGKWLWGYDLENDRFIAAEITDYAPGVNLYTYTFLTEKIAEKDPLTDTLMPEKASVKNQFEFKSHDLLVQTFTRNDKVISTFVIKRVID